MNKIKQTILVISLLFALGISWNTNCLADVGSFDRYDSGGSSWGSSSDWGSSSWGSGSWDDDDDDWIFGGTSSSGSSGSFSADGAEIIWMGLVAFIIVMAIVARKGKHSGNRYPRRRNIPTFQEANVPMNVHAIKDIQAIDPEFREETFLSWAKNLYVNMQKAWTKRDWEPIRSYESKELFEQHQTQLQGYIDTHRINVVDRIAVNYARIVGFKQEGGKDILTIHLKATKIDYIMDDRTQAVLQGNKTEDRVTVYQMVFERKTGILTKAAGEKADVTNCPNCGGPNHITSSGKCEYCGSMITTDKHDWVLTELEPV